MTDTHCHLDSCRDPVSAADPSLLAMVTIGTTPERNDAAIALAAGISNVWAAVGIHPNDAFLAEDPANLERVREQAQADRVVGIGETGFDTHWDRATLEQQQFAFDFHARLAEETGKPLILHIRDGQGGRTASERAVQAIRASGIRGGILHCFNGDSEVLETGLEAGWFVSFAGNLTYRNARQLQELAREVPADRLLIETDSPYLSPEPRRGRPNVPANVAHTCRFLAGLRDVSHEEMEQLTDRNAITAYSLPLERQV